MRRLTTHGILCLSLLLSSHLAYADYYGDDAFIGDDSDNYVSQDYYYTEPQEPQYVEEYPREEYIERRPVRYAEEEDYSYQGGSPRLPATISPPGERVIIVNPRVHAWGAYTAKGELLRSGLATSGSSWCSDLGRPCRTSSGSFRIYSLGSADCVSRKFPLGEGGAPMPYCMYFNGGQGIHGSNEVVEGNVSHGCVRVSVSDARWLRYNFVQQRTKVVIRPY